MSLAGLYTALYVKELNMALDVGIAYREAVIADHLLITHAHLDHIGSLPAFLGMRGMLMGKQKPLRVICPKGLGAVILEIISQFEKIHTWPLTIALIELAHGEEYQLSPKKYIRAIKAFHPVTTNGYVIFEKVNKLKQEYMSLSGAEIQKQKQNTDLFYTEYRYQLAYITDSLIEAYKHESILFEVDTLISECTFWDQKKDVQIARAGCHIHLDEFKQIAPLLKNKQIVLMHFSQLYRPYEIKEICDRELLPILGHRLQLILPKNQEDWWL